MLITHKPPKIFEPIGPYAQAIEATSVNRPLFISGTMGLEPDGTLIKDFATQAHRVWANIDATLSSAGMDRKNLAKLTIWLTAGWLSTLTLYKHRLIGEFCSVSVPLCGERSRSRMGVLNKATSMTTGF